MIAFVPLLPALPLLGALVAVFWPAAGGAVAASVAVAVSLLLIPLAGMRAPLATDLGGWVPPLGIALQMDGLAVAFAGFSAVVMLAVVVAAPFRGTGRIAAAFWPLALLLWGALNAIFLSRDLFNLYVGLELLSLAAVSLVALDGKAEAIAAALRYLVFALIGSLLYLLGAALVYAAHGSLDLADLPQRVVAAPDLLAAGLMTAGLLVKTALFPFHAWLPPAHSGAPAAASAMLSALVPKASFYILLRLWFDGMPDLGEPVFLALMGALGTAAILYGGLMALRQDRLKLLIAYSTVAQLGYLFLVFPLAGGADAAQPWAAGAWTATVFHAAAHAFAKAAMFLCAGLWLAALGHDRIEGLRGMVRTTPMLVFAFALSAVSLMGLPPSGGFTAKYLMVTSAFAAGTPLWALGPLAGGLLAAVYLYRPLAEAFGAPAPQDIRPVPRSRQIVPLLLALMAILLGVFSNPPFDLVQIGRPAAAVEGVE
ncbi:complex I subunit 5 family protein [Plastorhodobacter daqingensis]|uniref:Complex I subunit 5 family protein n=1 Tax=Plastorhodobacter daqingensis TaxID=1387281 RepID=A0ABW2UKY5_9RHOB